MWQLTSSAAWAPEYLISATPGGKVARSAVQPQCFARNIVDAAVPTKLQQRQPGAPPQMQKEKKKVSDHNQPIVVVGGGVSGIWAALTLSEHSRRVKVLSWQCQARLLRLLRARLAAAPGGSEHLRRGDDHGTPSHCLRIPSQPPSKPPFTTQARIHERDAARAHVESKAAQTSASWLSGGLFQIVLQPAPSSGQLGPAAAWAALRPRLGRAGVGHTRPCFPHVGSSASYG